MSRTIQELAAEIHDVLQERGWCKYDFVQNDGRVCVAGAASLVLHGRPDPHGLEGAKFSEYDCFLESFLLIARKFIGINFATAADANDHESMTHGDLDSILDIIINLECG